MGLKDRVHWDCARRHVLSGFSSLMCVVSGNHLTALGAVWVSRKPILRVLFASRFLWSVPYCLPVCETVSGHRRGNWSWGGSRYHNWHQQAAAGTCCIWLRGIHLGSRKKHLIRLALAVCTRLVGNVGICWRLRQREGTRSMNRNNIFGGGPCRLRGGNSALGHNGLLQ